MSTPEAQHAEPDGSPSAMRTFSEPTPVSLATLKHDRIHFDRAEAIAISQALCLALVTAQRRRSNAEGDVVSAGSPVTTETVFIDPASRVGVSVDDPGDEAAAIQAVGRIIADIVPSDARRSLETKIISKALASPPQFETVRELSQALAKFEQRGGRERIQAVYERWKKGEGTEPVRPTSRRSSTIRLGSQSKGVAAAVVTVALLVIGINAWLLVSRLDAKGSIFAATDDSPSTVETAPLVARPIAPVWGLVAWSVAGANRPALSMSPLSVIHAEPPVRTGRAAAVARIERPAPSSLSPAIARTETSMVVDSLTPQPTSELPPTAPQLGRSAGGEVASVSGTSDVTRRSNGVATAMSPATEAVKHAPSWPGAVSNLASSVTYTAGDAGVSPPIPILPRLLAGLQSSSPGVRLNALAIAVVVDENGIAHSVRGLNAPQNMGEYVLLTNALAVVKSWEFRPAVKDGTPVRYRLIVPLRELTRSDP